MKLPKKKKDDFEEESLKRGVVDFTKSLTVGRELAISL